MSVVPSLSPCQNYQKLKHLELFGVTPKNKSPLELSACKTLLSTSFSKYSKKLLDQYYENTGANDDGVPDFDCENYLHLHMDNLKLSTFMQLVAFKQ